FTITPDAKSTMNKTILSFFLLIGIYFNMKAQKFPYDDFQEFHNNFSVIKKDNLYGLIDNKGNDVISPKYPYLSFVENNHIVFCDNDNYYGIMDEKGNLLYKDKLENLLPSFNTNYFAAKKNGKWGFIDNIGTIIIPFIYSEITYFSNTDNLALAAIGDYPNRKYG